jgi:hypothetical protein
MAGRPPGAAATRLNAVVMLGADQCRAAALARVGEAVTRWT